MGQEQSGRRNPDTPVFVDYFDARRGKWRSAEINLEDEKLDMYQLVFWNDAGQQKVVQSKRNSPNIQPHGTYTMAQHIDRSTGRGVVASGATQVVGMPSGRGGAAPGTLVNVPASSAPAKLEPKFAADAPPDDVQELSKLLYLTANANIPDGRVDTSGSIGVGDMVDVKKSGTSHTEWAMAEVIDMKRDVQQMPWVRVQLLSREDAKEWIQFESDRLAPSGKRAGVSLHPYTAGHMVDILDRFTDKYGIPQETWRLATVKAVDCTRIQVHYEGWKSKWDHWIDVTTDEGKNRVAKAFRHTGSATDVGTLKKVQDESFRANLEKEGFKIFEMASDGNCLFRSVAHQVFGDVAHHPIVREQCCNYMQENKDHFQAFCDTGSSFESYIADMRKPTTWGGDVEIHAMEELYDHPIAIYSGDSSEPGKPMNNAALVDKEKLHGLKGVERITISYHGKSHYNSILHFTATLPLERRRTPGVLRRARLSGKVSSALSSPGSSKPAALPSRSPSAAELESKAELPASQQPPHAHTTHTGLPQMQGQPHTQQQLQQQQNLLLQQQQQLLEQSQARATAQSQQQTLLQQQEEQLKEAQRQKRLQEQQRQIPQEPGLPRPQHRRPQGGSPGAPQALNLSAAAQPMPPPAGPIPVLEQGAVTPQRNNAPAPGQHRFEDDADNNNNNNNNNNNSSSNGAKDDMDDDDIVTPIALTRVGSEGLSQVGAYLAHSAAAAASPGDAPAAPTGVGVAVASPSVSRGSGGGSGRSSGADDDEVVSAVPVPPR